MKLKVEIDGETHDVEVLPGCETVLLDGREVPADWRKIGPRTYSLLLGSRSFEVRVHAEGGFEAGSVRSTVSLYDDEYAVTVTDPRRAVQRQAALAGKGGDQKLVAPMHGKVVRVLVEPHATVTAGQGILVMEAMKMENELRSSRDGVVRELRVKPGDSVHQGSVLAVIS